MLDSVYGTRQQLKDDMKENRRNLSKWYYEQMAMYDYALANFDEWYREYAGESWEELNDSKDQLNNIFFVPSFLHYNKK